MGDGKGFPLRVVDGLALDPEARRALRPGELLRDREGRARRLPRFFFEVPSWEAAREVPLAPHFEAWEFLNVDVREDAVLRTRWPRYLPCAVALLASALEVLREEVGTYVHVAANGGYRSPAHGLTTHASAHCWGTAANLYRVGDDWLDDPATIVRYQRIVRRVLPTAWVRPYGSKRGEAMDHLHLDLGWAVVVPHDAPGEDDGPAPPDDGAAATSRGTKDAEADGTHDDGHPDDEATARERKE